jgi:hypothetical protein
MSAGLSWHTFYKTPRLNQQPSPRQALPWDPEDPPQQVCPEPRIMCWMPGCGGKPDPLDPFRCKSKSIIVVNSVATTLFACPCCPGGNWLHSYDEICDGEEEKCKKEPVKGCECRPRNPIYVGEYPVAYVCGAYASRFQRSTTPTEPPPTASEFWNLSSESCKHVGGGSMALEDSQIEISLRQTSLI